MKMKKSKGKGKIMMTFGLLLTVAALFLTCYNLWGEYQAKKNANEALLQVAELMQMETSEQESEGETATSGDAEESTVTSGPETTSGSSKPMPVRMVAGQDYIGIIEIPALSLELPIISEWDDAKLKIAPCRFVGSAHAGDLIISGHSYKNHFRYIRNLAVGSQVTFTDFEGTRFVYEVIYYEVIGGDDVDGMLAGDWDLTLFTCTYNGSARHTVRCRLIPEENPWMQELEAENQAVTKGLESTGSSESAESSETTESQSDDEEETEENSQDIDLIDDLTE